MKSSLLYTLSVPWSWIEQRPQILANLLADSFDITCVSPRSLIKAILRTDKEGHHFKGVSRAYYCLPKQVNRGVVRVVNNAVNKHRCFRDIDCFDCIWLSHPCQIDCVSSTYKGIVVYDCMDDHVAMAHGDEKANLLHREKKLIDRADIIFVSSNYLMNKICSNKTILVRNGYKQGNLHPVSKSLTQSTYTIAYFGTVSKWFDFDAIKAVVRELKNIYFRIIGPAEVKQEIEHVVYKSAVSHQELFDSVSDCSCLIMPFKVNDITNAVDPVKLYEYIAFGKCIISVKYPEVERFADYVYFYESTDELVALIADLENKGFPPKYTERSRSSFLRENTWERRAETIVSTLVEYGVAKE